MSTIERLKDMVNYSSVEFDADKLDTAFAEDFNLIGNTLEEQQDTIELLEEKTVGLNICWAYNASFSVGNGTNFIAALTDTAEETANMHNPTTNNSRITILRDGNYSLYGSVDFASAFSASRVLAWLQVNGTDLFNRSGRFEVSFPTTQGAIQTFIPNYKLEAGDYVELRTGQNSGSAQSARVNLIVRELPI